MLSGILGKPTVFSTLDPDTAIEIATKHKDLDWVFIGLDFPTRQSLDLLNDFKRKNVTAPVIVFCREAYGYEPAHAIELGISGIVTKATDIDEIRLAMKRIEANGQYIAPEINDQLRHENKLREQRTMIEENLNQRQREILKLMGQGMRNIEIANALDIAESTVKNNISVLLSAFLASNRVQCLAEAKKLGLL